jgi:hypothetical protein
VIPSGDKKESAEKELTAFTKKTSSVIPSGDKKVLDKG